MMSKPAVFVCTGIVAMVLAFASAPAISAEKVVHSFEGGATDGAAPFGAPILDTSGNLIGTTTEGGSGTQCAFGHGCGTIFRLAPDGSETLLYAFAGGCDGAFPSGSLLPDSAGNYYGTTGGGGACTDEGAGTVFKLAPDGTETVLYAFKGRKDGDAPQGSLIADKKGNLYGATSQGGSNGGGTVFEVTPSGKETVLHSFEGGSDGTYPLAGVVRDGEGNLYGTTTGGGGGVNCGDGCGIVYKLAPDGTETVLYAFQDGNDGATPVGTLILDKAGNLYGTTAGGGSGNHGTVFKVTPDGTETVLYSFAAGLDGNIPEAGLTMDKSGNLYGTTIAGGGGHCKNDGCGVVFKLAPDGTETVLYAFANRGGTYPAAGLLMGKNDTLYGTTTAGGGKHNDGVVFSVPAK